jgi:hypothetical protein
MGGQQEETRRFVASPGYTQVPNVLLEDVLREIATLAELKVTMAIVRNTFGWGKAEKLISLTDLQAATGLSRQSAQKGVEAALERGFIGRRRDGHGFIYGLRVAKNVGSSGEVKESSSLTSKSLDPRPPSIPEKESPTDGKERGAPASGASANKTKGRNGDLFKPDPEKPGDAVIVEVFDAWAKGTGCTESAQLTVGRSSKIRARLQEAARLCPEGIEAIDFARAQLLEAVKGMATSKWHEQNDQQDFTQLFRNRERIEFFLGRLAKTGKERDGQERFAAYEAAVER